MDDAIRATIELMNVKLKDLSITIVIIFLNEF